MDNTKKPGIPTWQLSEQSSKGKDEGDQSASHPEPEPPSQTPKASAGSPNEDASMSGRDDATMPSDTSQAGQLEKIAKFLEDPAVKEEPREKKRAFLKSKDIPEALIDRALGPESRTEFTTSSFQDFRQSQTQPSQTGKEQAGPYERAPPIITYPEFLVDAHKPPPLITAQRVLDAAYLFGGLGALIYGASRFLFAPMSAALGEARHEFAQHSQSKLEEMNERLSKLVSQDPLPQRALDLVGRAGRDATDDGASIDSDPYELFHRDIGVQTSPLPSKNASVVDGSSDGSDGSDVGDEHGGKKKTTTTDGHTRRLRSLQRLLDDIYDQGERVKGANSERGDASSKLQDYLDKLLYTQPSGNPSWSLVASERREQRTDDKVEMLKKEIRSVKGVMLSASRFPAASVR